MIDVPAQVSEIRLTRGEGLRAQAGGPLGLIQALTVLVLLRLGQLGVVVWMAGEGRTLQHRLLIWDGGWLINVAMEGYPPGYSYDHSGQITGNGYAFFPLFPLLVRGVATLGIPPESASLIVAGGAGLAGGLLIYLLGTALWSRRVGLILMVLVCAQPMSVVLLMGYTESLFLALVAGALLAAHQRVWWAAGLLGMGAALTRPTGAAVGVALAVAVLLLWRDARDGVIELKRHERGQALGAAALALVAVPAFLAFVAVRVGEWDAWFVVQTKGWGTTFDFGDSVSTFVGEALRRTQGVVDGVTVWLILGALALCLAALWGRVWPPLLVFGWVSLVLVLGQAGYWHSKPRLLIPVLLLACVPLARTLARGRNATVVAVLAVWVAFGFWFGAYMITVWPYTI